MSEADFFGMAAGEVGGRGAGVVAAAVAHAKGVFMREAGEDGEVGLVRREGREGGGKFVVRANFGRRPLRHVDAVGNIHERHALREFLGGGAAERGTK